MTGKFASSRHQRGVTLFGLMFWAILIGMTALVVMRVLPTVNEYYTILRAVEKIAKEGGGTVPEIRNAFERQKQIEYSISSLSSMRTSSSRMCPVPRSWRISTRSIP